MLLVTCLAAAGDSRADEQSPSSSPATVNSGDFAEKPVLDKRPLLRIHKHTAWSSSAVTTSTDRTAKRPISTSKAATETIDPVLTGERSRADSDSLPEPNPVKKYHSEGKSNSTSAKRQCAAITPESVYPRASHGTPVVNDLEEGAGATNKSMPNASPLKITRKRRPRAAVSEVRQIGDLANDERLTVPSHQQARSSQGTRRMKSRVRLTNAEQSQVDVSIKPLDRILATTTPPSGRLPPNAAARYRDQQPEVWQDDDRHYPERTVFWEATNYQHQPLYFEEINLERHGYDRGCLQPVFSAGNFYGSVALWPYKLVCYPWYECQSPLGHYRPGSCAPYRCHRLPWRLDAALVEVGAWTGLAFLLP